MKNFPAVIYFATVGFLLFIFISRPVSAQNLNAPDYLKQGLQLPESITQIFDLGKKISINLQGSGFIRDIVEKVQGNGNSSPSNIFSGVLSIWDRSNDWLQSNIGISLREIITAIGNLFIWILNFVIGLIQSALGYSSN
ncbi:MAG: hypothetical protein AAB432_02155 [Patescibacteria group bacterium]